MLGTFLKHYLELPAKTKNVVCLGGGVGTAQILKGLRHLPFNLTAVVSMADDGGSAGRLRRAFAVPPPGDLVNCLAALSDEESVIRDLFLYRFGGKRHGKDTDLSGQKLGNLIFVALTDIYKGDHNKALEEFSKIVSSRGRVLPATAGNVNIWAKTSLGKRVYGESKIDLGKYKGTASLEELHLDPANAQVYPPTLAALKNAQVIIAGPGDLFSTVLPVLIVPQIKKQLVASSALKIFITNTTNKPFETSGFKVSDYVKTVEKHIGQHIFDKILVNTNMRSPIPKDLNYQFVSFDKRNLSHYRGQIIEGDFVNSHYPLYHDPTKVAKLIEKLT